MGYGEDRFEWDPVKAEANLRKHGVSFEEARTIFFDPLARTMPDPQHSLGERRFVSIGMAKSGRLLVVPNAERNGRIRIISARGAVRHERRIYERG